MKQRPLISVIDDDPSVCRAIKRLLESTGMHVLCYLSAAEFIEQGLRHLPDCIILDIHMPKINGIDLRARLRGSDARLPIVFITAHEDEVLKHRLLQDPAVDYIRKPFTDDQLIGSIRHLLETEKQTAIESSEPQSPTIGKT